MLIEILKFIFYSTLIVIISKYILVTTLRKLAESLDLKAKTVGNIAGYATSVPEFLTITTSSLRGLSNASVFNILSSNIINLIQYLGTITINKNISKLRNKAIIIELIMILLTIIIPILLLVFKIEINIAIVPFFIILFSLFIYINNNVHKLYLQKQDKQLKIQIEKEQKWERGNKFKILKYSIYLLATGILLFIIGNLLGENLENLCNLFNVPQIIIGILLGFITSLPELITFFESQKHYNKVKEEILGVVEATNNLFTSNIVNLFLIQTVGILVISIL